MVFKDMLDLVNKEKRKKERSLASRQCAIGICIAGSAGFLMGILCAPRSGKETRAALMKKAAETVDTVKDKAHETMETVQDKAHEAIEAVHDKAHDTIEAVHDKAHEMEETMRESKV